MVMSVIALLGAKVDTNWIFQVALNHVNQVWFQGHARLMMSVFGYCFKEVLFFFWAGLKLRNKSKFTIDQVLYG